MKRYIGILTVALAFLLPLSAVAQRLTLHAPSSVQVGDNFKIVYTIDTHDQHGFTVGDFPDGLEVLYGPSRSTSSSVSVINGNVTKSESVSFSYILVANKAGSFTLPAGTVKSGDKTITSNTETVAAVAGQQRQQGQQQSQRGQRQQQQQGGVPSGRSSEAGNAISPNDLFFTVTASKQNVHEQEAILLTYKIYSVLDLNNLSSDIPDFQGFHTQEVDPDRQRTLQIENYKGRNYYSCVWRQFVLYPQQTGDLTIPDVTFDANVRQRIRHVDPFEAFFNGGSSEIYVDTKVKARGLKIHVEKLPQRPYDFANAVGDFTMTAKPDKTSVKAGDPVTIRIEISGTGNFPLISEPTVNLPDDFIKYDPQVTEKTKLTTGGNAGKKIYTVMIVPENQGTYTIDPVTFTYFDPNTNQYKTLKSEPFELKVAKGSGKSTVVDYSGGKKVDNDLHQISFEKPTPRNSQETFFGSGTYWIVILCLLAAFVILVVFFRNRAIRNADFDAVRGRKANKVATKRLKTAAALMKRGDDGKFYDEVLRALWGYVSDKLSMPVEQLSRENISNNLTERGIEEGTISLFLTALDECEFERYAPGDKAGNMGKTYDAAAKAIMNIEDSMKKTKKSGKALNSALLIIATMLALPFASAEAKTADEMKISADSAYTVKNFQMSISLYEQILREGEDANVYYNLGNSYYRTGRYIDAALNLERALRLAPGNDDVRHNLMIVRKKLAGGDEVKEDNGLQLFWRSVTFTLSSDAWAIVGIVSLALMIILFVVYLFAEAMWLRKLGFFSSVLLLLAFIAANICGWSQTDYLDARTEALTMENTPFRVSPSATAAEMESIKPGTKLQITDKSMNSWYEVDYDGKKGWVERKHTEII